MAQEISIVTIGTGGLDVSWRNRLSEIIDGIASFQMAEDQKQKLTELLARIRHESFEEGYAKGYEAALKELEIAAGNVPASGIQSDLAETPLPLRVSSKATEERLARGFKPRLTSGLADKMVRETIKTVAPREITQTELIHRIKQEFDSAIPFTTMRRSLNRLLAEGIVRHNTETEHWSYVGPDGPKLRSIR